FFPAPVQVSAGDGHRESGALLVRRGSSPVPRPLRRDPVLSERVMTWLALCLLAASGLGALRLLDRWRGLRRLCRAAVPIRRIGRLSVRVSDAVTVPFSAWTGRRAE